MPRGNISRDREAAITLVFRLGIMTPSFAIEFLVWMLIAAAVIAALAGLLRIPYTVALVLGGITLGSMHLPVIDTLVNQRPEWLSPNATLVIFLPPLLFEGSLKIPIRLLRQNMTPVLLLATIGVVMTTAITGMALHWMVGMPLLVALTFGALVAATDPISVLAIFKDLAVSKRLSVIVEGESLFNDGASAVLFSIMAMGAVTGHLGMAAGLREFMVQVVGGAAVGIALGFVLSKVTEHIDEPQVEIMLTTILAYGAYLAAESVGVSGVTATVAGGILMGNVGARQGMSLRTRATLWSFWEYAAFVINSIVFLLIGLQVQMGELLRGWRPIALAVVAVLAGRAVVVYTLVPVSNLLDSRIPGPWAHVLFQAGMRGALSLALALSLDTRFPYRSQLLAMTFGVVAFTIVAHGLTIKPALRLLHLAGPEEGEFERTRVRQIALAAARSELDAMLGQHVLSAPVHERLRLELDKRMVATGAKMDQIFEQDEARLVEEMRVARGRLLAAERSSIEEAVRDGSLSPHSATMMIADADHELAELTQAPKKTDPAA